MAVAAVLIQYELHVKLAYVTLIGIGWPVIPALQLDVGVGLVKVVVVEIGLRDVRHMQLYLQFVGRTSHCPSRFAVVALGMGSNVDRGRRAYSPVNVTKRDGISNMAWLFDVNNAWSAP